MRLDGKVALITGGASGIGQATARLFAKEGAKVVIADINDKMATETSGSIKKAGGEATFVHADMCVLTDLENMVKETVKRYGKLNIFYHNAGIRGVGSLEKTSEQNWDKQMAVHLKAGFFGAKYAIPEIKKSGGGSILFTSSGAGAKAHLGNIPYGLAKAGLIMLAKYLAIQYIKDNIRVNCILPGITPTPFYAQVNMAEVEQKWLQSIPIGRFAKPEEIAAAALFLVSDEASYITGVALPVDGGILAT